MNAITLLALAVLLVLVLLYRRLGQISVRHARVCLRRGALLIDVRTAGEYVANHLPQAMNLPLGELEANIARRVPDPAQVLLLHCHSGARSAAARRRLRAMGYTHAYNLGSFARAKQIVSGA